MLRKNVLAKTFGASEVAGSISRQSPLKGLGHHCCPWCLSHSSVKALRRRVAQSDGSITGGDARNAWGPRQASETQDEDALPPTKLGARHFPTFHCALRLRGETCGCEDYFRSAPETSFHEDIVNVHFGRALA
jgi:hypothetical protein